MSTSTIAAIRFGTGLSPVQPPPDSAEALLASLAGPDTLQARYPVMGLDTMRPLIRDFAAARKERRSGGAAADERFKALRTALYDARLDGFRARLMRAVVSPDGFRERLTTFWADHFTVRAKNVRWAPGPAAFIDEAIRPHLAGRFAELLRAAATHPVMLAFLDQSNSIGPDSPAGARRDAGLNENLAREILELHTLGVDAGYTQDDVRQFAELLTGLSFDLDTGFRFRPRWAEPGSETLFGKSYGGDGPATLDDIHAALDDIARHPATAAHVSRKLAVHFVADDPDPGLIDAMSAAWRASDADLAQVYAAMLAHPAAWSLTFAKVRQPWDFIVASLRALGTEETALAALKAPKLRRLVLQPLERMGQPYEKPPGPDGWPEAADAWITPPGLAERITWAMNVERLHGTALPDPGAFAATALGDYASETLAAAVRGADSRRTGVGLVLASSEFNRR